MVVAAMFASPLFALDESPPGVKTFNSTNAGNNIYDKNGLGLVGAAHADDLTRVKVDIQHKDTLMYSWDQGIMKKLGFSGNASGIEMDKMKSTIGSATYGADMDKIKLAVVCHLRGVVGGC